MSHRASLLGRGYQDNHLDSPRVRFRRALLLCLMTVVVPGSGHIAVGKRAVGWFAVTLWVAAARRRRIPALEVPHGPRRGASSWFTDTDVLLLARAGIVAVGGALGHPVPRRVAPRVAVPAQLHAGGVHHGAQPRDHRAASPAPRRTPRSSSRSRATPSRSCSRRPRRPSRSRAATTSCCSARTPGKDRTGIRPDSMTVASIDADTGKVVLISLPRNLQNVPFSKGSPMRKLYPYGYNCGADLPAQRGAHGGAEPHGPLSRQQGSGARRHDRRDPGRHEPQDQLLRHGQPQRVQGPRQRGRRGRRWTSRRASRCSATTTPGRTRYIEPGKQKLNGQQALWYARSRVQSDDYTRMGRQKCLMAAMADQLSPQKVLLNATKIAKSGKELLSTNIPAKELGQFADLALKSRGAEDPHGVGRAAGVQHRRPRTSRRSRRRSRRRSTSRSRPSSRPRSPGRPGPRRQPDRRPRSRLLSPARA